MNNCWRYKKKSICSIEDIPKEFQNDNTVHILYKISIKCNPGYYYYGKKILYNKKKIILSQKKKLELKTKKKSIITYSISSWADYYGSSTNIEWLELMDKLGHDKFDREILMFVKGKSKAAFYEAKYLFSDEGMMHPKCMNLNILSRFFKKQLINDRI